jgi:hypothetical protein
MRTSLVVAVAGCAAIGLAGCGTQHVTPGVTKGVTSGVTKGVTPSVTTVGTGQAATAGTTASAPSPAQRAAADAASMLAAFSAPPGAVRTGPLPVSWLAQAAMSSLSPDLVSRTAWWRVPGQPQAVLGWVRAHVPAGFTLAGSGSQGPPLRKLEPGHPGPVQIVGQEWNAELSRPPVAGLFDQRQLVVAVARYTAGQTALRVDAQVVWLPPKPAAEQIPASARVVTITAIPGVGPPAGYDQPVTITDPAKVARIAAVVNALPVFPPGMMSCPMDQGRAMRLTFKAAPAGTVLAVVTGEIAGCGGVAVTIGGKPMLTLRGGYPMQQQVSAIVGLHWPGFPAG